MTSIAEMLEANNAEVRYRRRVRKVMHAMIQLLLCLMASGLLTLIAQVTIEALS